MRTKRQNPIPESKKNTVKELAELIKSKKTILIVSIKNIPGSQFQEITKKLRGKAVVKVPKKNIMFRAIDNSGNGVVEKLKEQFQESVAILFSDTEAFELASELEATKSPAKAKVGQEAPIDIEVEAGMTELVPGPAISELGAVGLKTKVTNGKLEIIQSKIIVKEGGKISQAVADVMSKLDIKPFSIGFIPLSAFDTQEGKFYSEIKVDREGTLEKLKEAHSRALPFAVEIGHPTEDTIKFLIGKAGGHGKALEKFKDGEEKEEEKEKIAEADASEDKKDVDNEKEDKPVEQDSSSDNSSEQSEPTGEANDKEESKDGEKGK
ncbi:50S ribosomal protein L10 [Candidatus Pacearchaeota archaeon]|nr:50S ribosomal protein L10 [Candidatus Pacearchaeota archaeon]